MSQITKSQMEIWANLLIYDAILLLIVNERCEALCLLILNLLFPFGKFIRIVYDFFVLNFDFFAIKSLKNDVYQKIKVVWHKSFIPEIGHHLWSILVQIYCIYNQDLSKINKTSFQGISSIYILSIHLDRLKQVDDILYFYLIPNVIHVIQLATIQYQ